MPAVVLDGKVRRMILNARVFGSLGLCETRGDLEPGPRLVLEEVNHVVSQLQHYSFSEIRNKVLSALANVPRFAHNDAV